jgi:hypothetical protein
MKKVTVELFLLGVLLYSGCSTPEIKLDPTLTTFSRDELERMDPIRLPANYSVSNFKRLQMGVAFEAVGGVDKTTGTPLPISPDLSSRLQTEMAKLKRFTIYSAHNRGGVTFFEDLSDVDPNAKLTEASQVRNIDLVLSGRVTVTKERQDRYNDTLLIYEVECDFSCEDLKTHTVKFAEKAKGRTARKQLFSITQRKLAGYDDADEQQAITQAAMKALAVVANKLGNTFPVGGEISGITSSGERMTLDKGFDDGIGAKQQCVVFINDGGVDVPVALAEAVPGNNTSSLSIYKWNHGDKDAEPLVKALLKDPRGFMKNGTKVYAVGYGLSVPPEWESANKGSMDEQMRLK